MANVGVIGWGYVGSATGKGFSKNKKNKIFWYDKYKKSPNTLDEVVEKSEFIFVCLPTPMFRDYSGMDMSIVNAVVEEISSKVKNTKKVLIVKSTVLPGTTALLAKKFKGINFAMNPEFLTQDNAEKDFMNPSRTVIGAMDDKVARRIKRLYATILPKDQKYFLTDTTSAELAKYMSNLMLASKTLLANEFYAVAKKLKINYDEVRKMVEADPRMGSHLKVPGPDGDFGFGGACFPKDMLGLIAFAKKEKIDVSALEAVWKKNLKIRKNRDWEKRDNAFGRGASKKK
jgi:UDPglucose 6-dehydrogenase